MNVVQEHNKDEESKLSIWSLALEQTHHPVCTERAQDKQGEFPRDTLVVGVNEVEWQLYLYVQAA